MITKVTLSLSGKIFCTCDEFRRKIFEQLFSANCFPRVFQDSEETESKVFGWYLLTSAAEDPSGKMT